MTLNEHDFIEICLRYFCPEGEDDIYTQYENDLDLIGDIEKCGHRVRNERAAKNNRKVWQGNFTG